MRRGPEYDLLGLRLVDVTEGCGRCHKRLAEVIHDSDGNLPAGRLYCVDCGTVAPAYDKPTRLVASRVAPGRHVAVCTLCSYASMPTSLDRAAGFARQHLTTKHGTAA